MVELRQLETLRVLAEELHFGRAAERLFLAQASVSQQLRKLEDELGVRLLHRTSRSVRLTPAGSAFLVEAERVLAAVDRARDAVRTVAAGREGAVRIGANYPAGRLLLFPLLDVLSDQHPDLEPVVREAGSSELLRDLVEGEIDLALVYGPFEHPGLQSVQLRDVAIDAMVRDRHPLADAGSVTFEQLSAHAISTGYRGGSSWIENAVVSHACSAGVDLEPRRSDADLAGYLLELQMRDLVAFSSSPRARRTSDLRALSIVPTPPTIQLHAAWATTTHEPLVNVVTAALVGLARTGSNT